MVKNFCKRSIRERTVTHPTGSKAMSVNMAEKKRNMSNINGQNKEQPAQQQQKIQLQDIAHLSSGPSRERKNEPPIQKSSELMTQFFEKGNEEIKLLEKKSMNELLHPYEEGFEQRVIESLDKEQLSEFKKAFSHFDRDGDGTMRTNELRTAMRNLGQNPTDQELHEMIIEVDMNENGTIDLIEFLYIMIRMLRQEDNEETIKAAFHVFDDNTCGYIEANEFEETLRNSDETLSEREIREILKKAGDISNNKITYEQFAQMMIW